MTLPYDFKIWFSQGNSMRKHFWSHPWRWKLRLLRREPALCYYLFGSNLIGWITGCTFSHVLVEFDDVVLDPMFTRNKYWPADTFEKKYPGRRLYFSFQSSQPIDISKWEQTKPWGPVVASVWGTVFRFILFFTKGRVRLSDDCVSMAVDALKTSGVKVPVGVVSPLQLMNWLKEQGYACTAYTTTYKG